MSRKKTTTFTDNELRIASQYLRYHIRMYIETLRELQNYFSSTGWNTLGNALLEDHLVHARVLINFFCNTEANSRDDDVIAKDYFLNSPLEFNPIADTFLIDQAKDIGGKAIHITTKPMPYLRSQTDWPISGISSRLAPVIDTFLKSVPEEKLESGVKQDCLSFLANLRLHQIPVSLHSTT